MKKTIYFIILVCLAFGFSYFMPEKSFAAESIKQNFSPHFVKKDYSQRKFEDYEFVGEFFNNFMYACPKSIEKSLSSGQIGVFVSSIQEKVSIFVINLEANSYAEMDIAETKKIKTPAELSFNKIEPESLVDIIKTKLKTTDSIGSISMEIQGPSDTKWSFLTTLPYQENDKNEGGLWKLFWSRNEIQKDGKLLIVPIVILTEQIQQFYFDEIKKTAESQPALDFFGKPLGLVAHQAEGIESHPVTKALFDFVLKKMRK